MKIRRNLTFLLMACVLYSPGSVFGQGSRNNPIQTNQTPQNEYERKALRLVAFIQAGDTEGATAYDAACAFARAGKKEEAFRYLELAIARGYSNSEHMKKDSDLESLRTDTRWQRVIEKAEAKRAEQQSIFWNKKEFWDNPALETPYKENLNEDEKIAGLAKFWSEAKFNFPNFDLVPELNWDAAFLEFLPRVRQTKTTLEYYLVLQELCAKLKDGHTNVAIPSALNDEVYARPLINTRRIEDKVLITRVYDNELLQNDIARGQEIVEMDGIPVLQYAEQRLKPYLSASTKQDLEQRRYELLMLSGSVKNPIELTLLDTNSKLFKKTVARLSIEEQTKRIRELSPKPAPRQLVEFKMLSGNVTYVALNSFNDPKAAEQFEANFDQIAKASALVIDIRENSGGSSTVGYRILGHLTDKPFKVSSWHTRQYRSSFRAWQRAQEPYRRDGNEQSPNGKRFFSKPVIVLTSGRTYSAAEDFLVAFDTMKRGLIIGEPSGGSTGQPLIFNLPGGGAAAILTKRDKYPDGREFVGKGIHPHKFVAPTVADFRTSRDTVLEAALMELKSFLSK